MALLLSIIGFIVGGVSGYFLDPLILNFIRNTWGNGQKNWTFTLGGSPVQLELSVFVISIVFFALLGGFIGDEIGRYIQRRKKRNQQKTA